MYKSKPEIINGNDQFVSNSIRSVNSNKHLNVDFGLSFVIPDVTAARDTSQCTVGIAAIV
jgi:hypothetical protein